MKFRHVTGREVAAIEGSTLAARLAESNQWERVDDAEEKPRSRTRKKADDDES